MRTVGSARHLPDRGLQLTHGRVEADEVEGFARAAPSTRRSATSAEPPRPVLLRGPSSRTTGGRSFVRLEPLRRRGQLQLERPEPRHVPAGDERRRDVGRQAEAHLIPHARGLQEVGAGRVEVSPDRYVLAEEQVGVEQPLLLAQLRARRSACRARGSPSSPCARASSASSSATSARASSVAMDRARRRARCGRPSSSSVLERDARGDPVGLGQDSGGRELAVAMARATSR